MSFCLETSFPYREPLSDRLHIYRKLNKEQWAWEFLRRNPEYQRDYKVFIHRWNSLEADYGEAPNPDTQRWQNDLCSLANEWDRELTLLEVYPDSNQENASQETVLIEDWMGIK
ncbi:MAG: hypothetical protein ACI88H_001059 [Cocleimonas sp.]